MAVPAQAGDPPTVYNDIVIVEVRDGSTRDWGLDTDGDGKSDVWVQE